MTEVSGTESVVSEQASSRPTFTLSEAEEVTGASRSTLRRRLADGAFPNAERVGKTQQWRIPVEDLLAAGLRVNAPSSGYGDEDEQAGTAAVSPAEQLRDRVTELEQQLALAQARAAAAEQLADERAARVEDLRVALRMLEAAAPATPAASVVVAEEDRAAVPATPQRPRWWRRSKGSA